MKTKKGRLEIILQSFKVCFIFILTDSKLHVNFQCQSEEPSGERFSRALSLNFIIHWLCRNSPHSILPNFRSRCAHAVSTLSASQSCYPARPRRRQTRWSSRLSNTRRLSCCTAATPAIPRWADQATPQRSCCRTCLMDVRGFHCGRDT